MTRILCYHSVDRDWDSALSIPVDTFDRHVTWLAGRFTVLPIDRALREVGAGGRLPAGTTALTFDDGYSGVYEHAFPVLARLALPASLFVVAATLTSALGPRGWLDPKDRGDRPVEVLGIDQIREMQESGVVVGSHGNTHRDLTALSEEEAERDLRESRETLEDMLGRPVQLLAYPRGRNDSRVRRAARRAGFTHGLSLPESREPVDALAVPRVGVYRGDGVAALRAKLSRWYLPLRTGPLYPMARRVTRAVRSFSSRPGG